MVKFSKFCSESLHGDTDRRSCIQMATGKKRKLDIPLRAILVVSFGRSVIIASPVTPLNTPLEADLWFLVPRARFPDCATTFFVMQIRVIFALHSSLVPPPWCPGQLPQSPTRQSVTVADQSGFRKIGHNCPEITTAGTTSRCLRVD